MEYTLSKESASLFESIKHIDENGVEFWFGRELAPYLGYAQWRNFESVIEKAKDACKTASGDVLSNFADVSKIVKTGVAEKEVQDVKLTRYACLLLRTVTRETKRSPKPRHTLSSRPGMPRFSRCRNTSA